MDLAPRGWVVATAFWAIWCTRLVLITAVCVYTFLERRFPVAIAEIHSTESVSLARYTYRPGRFGQRKRLAESALPPPRWRRGVRAVPATGSGVIEDALVDERWLSLHHHGLEGLVGGGLALAADPARQLWDQQFEVGAAITRSIQSGIDLQWAELA